MGFGPDRRCGQSHQHEPRRTRSRPGSAAGDPDALTRNVLVVAAAGNCGDGSCGSPDPPEYPGAYADVSFPAFHNHGVIAVGALNGTNPASIVRASFSNFNPYVTVAAPGVSIESTLPFSGPLSSSTGFGLLSGTSMATPHVAAVAALIYERCPMDTPTQVEARILSGTQANGTFGFGSPTVGDLARRRGRVGRVCP